MEHQVQHNFIVNRLRHPILTAIPQTCHSSNNRDQASCQVKGEVVVVARQASIRTTINKLLTLLAQVIAI